MAEELDQDVLSLYLKSQQFLFIAEQCLNLTKKSLFPILREYGLNHSQYLILMILRYAELSDRDVISSELSYLLAREKHSITTSVDYLFKNKLIIRHRSKTDRRAVFLKLTKEGKSLIEKVQSLTIKTVASFSRGSENTFKQLFSFLETFRIQAAQSSGQDPDTYRNAYNKLLLAGENKFIEKFLKEV